MTTELRQPKAFAVRVSYEKDYQRLGCHPNDALEVGQALVENVHLQRCKNSISEDSSVQDLRSIYSNR